MILWKNDPRRGRVVVGCCDDAARLGVRLGIAIAQATELVHQALSRPNKERSTPLPTDRSPIAIEHDPIADRVALEKIADQLQVTVSPMVAIETIEKRPWAGRLLSEPDTLLCDLSGVTHLFDDEPGVLRSVHQMLSTFGVVGKLAIADNLAAAWAHAHHNPEPDFVSSHGVNDLRSLSIDGLRIETETQYTLHRLGIQTIGSVLNLPRPGLARRLGKTLVDRIAEITGEIDVPLQVHHAEQQIAATHELEYPTDDLEIIEDRVTRLVEQIVARLATNQRGALRLVCRLDLIGRSQLTTTIGLFSPTLEKNHLARLVYSSIEASRPKSSVTKLTLMVLQSDRLRSRQNSLFAQTDPSLAESGHSDRNLAQLVDSLTGRLGRDAVLGVRLGNNPLPEKAYRIYALTDHRTRKALSRLPTTQRPQRQGRSFKLPSAMDSRRRPVRLLRQPMPLGTPTRSSADRAGRSPFPVFRFDGDLHRVSHWWGPERIESGWWEGPTIRRDYYRIETDTGHLWWVFREITSGQWFLHGRFS
ncbi:Y-family DNA polymerase [Roseiconus lacunae]|uniref:Y-family DNA polymerase n=1 Tax=Roseiconus lacunae TaxID=2605694 RepID=UPI0011F1EBA9|nr:DNA polymerase Y family protein [Roseiconus lacunae]